MDKYCLYYIHKTDDQVSDVLMIYFGGFLNAKHKANVTDDIEVLYNEKPIAYVINNFSRLCKVKINGTIFLPNDALVDLINAELQNAGLETLSYKDDSGFFVAEVTEFKENKTGNIVTVKLNDSLYKTITTFALKPGDKVVYACDETYLYPGTMINQYRYHGEWYHGRICSYDDLQMECNEPHSPIYVELGLVGEDFFQMEEKTNA